MPIFLQEDGTGIENATSYVSVTYADDYLGSAWAADTSAKQSALMFASEYADLKYGSSLRGHPLTTTQGLEFPRNLLYDRYGNAIEGVPGEWAKAVCLYAKEYAVSNLYVSSPEFTQNIKSKKVSAGPVGKELEFFSPVSLSSFKTFPVADSFAALFCYRKSGVIRA